MGLLLNLYLGHLLGDFLLQPGRLVVAKRRGVVGMLIHVTLVGAATSFVLFRDLSEHWDAVLMVTAFHLAVDVISVSLYQDTPTRGLYTFAMDQAMHMLSIVFTVWATSGWSLEGTTWAFGLEIDTGTLAGAVGLLAVMLVGSILVFETTNSALMPDGGKGAILKMDLPRLAGMLERGSALGLGIMYPPLIWLPFVPRTAWALTRPPRERAHQLVIGATELALCMLALAGIAAVVFLVG